MNTEQFTRAPGSLGVVFFPAFDWAISPTHPEREERLLYTRDQLKEEGLFDIEGITEYRPSLLPSEWVTRVHFCLPSLSATVSESDLVAAGGAVTAARLVLEKKEHKAFALVRPPGHHAMRVVHANRGFCDINNEAIMLDWVRRNYLAPEQGRALRVAIVDTDVHHADGTQDIFWNDPDTLFISLHQDGRTLYPGSGFISESGGPAALGRTVNIPLPPGTSDEGYLHVIEHVVLPILRDFKPDLIINSAGQDNHFTDPLANELLTARGYAALNARLNPDIAVLEGGYSIRGALPYVNLAICLALAGLPAGDIVEPDWTPEKVRQAPEIMPCVCRVADLVLEQYFNPPVIPYEGSETGGMWVRERHVYYDTNGVRERQRQSYRLCPDCYGYALRETASSRTSLSYCMEIPRCVCPSCLEAARAKLEGARRSGRYAHVLLIDESDGNPVQPWPLEAKTWQETF